jgi:hypothetical protein
VRPCPDLNTRIHEHSLNPHAHGRVVNEDSRSQPPYATSSCLAIGPYLHRPRASSISAWSGCQITLLKLLAGSSLSSVLFLLFLLLNLPPVPVVLTYISYSPKVMPTFPPHLFPGQSSSRLPYTSPAISTSEYLSRPDERVGAGGQEAVGLRGRFLGGGRGHRPGEGK